MSDLRQRWRLVLGRYADKGLPGPMDPAAQRAEAVLDYLYGREYAGRAVREGTLHETRLSIPGWIAEVRDLFPKETAETIQRHALDRYGMTELITDVEILQRFTPNEDLLHAILAFKDKMEGPVLQAARRIVREVVEELTQKLEPDLRRTFSGKQNRHRHSPLKVAQNFDARGTIRRNLQHWDRASGRLVPQDLRFFSRIDRRIPWNVIVAVDQSGSMMGSVVHSAITAGILSRLPGVRVHLCVFDTNVVDLSGCVDDPVEVLMSVQLGGGTNIGQAVSYAETLIDNPGRTVFVLVTDFYEGASERTLVAAVRRLAEAGVKTLGLAALDENAEPDYDRGMAERLAAVGMEIGALTPRRLAEWLVKAIS